MTENAKRVQQALGTLDNEELGVFIAELSAYLDEDDFVKEEGRDRLLEYMAEELATLDLDTAEDR